MTPKKCNSYWQDAIAGHTISKHTDEFLGTPVAAIELCVFIELYLEIEYHQSSSHIVYVFGIILSY